MIALLLFTGVAVVSGLAGLLVFWLRRKSRLKVLLIVLGILFGILFTIGAAGVFAVSWLNFPATDDAGLRGSDVLKVIFIEPAEIGHLHFAFRGQTAVYEDFEIAAQMNIRLSEDAAKPPYRFEIQAPKSFELRTPDRCELASVPEVGYYACASASSQDDFLVRWDVTPTATGSARLRLLLPEALRPQNVLGPNWKAIVFYNDMPVPAEKADQRFYGSEWGYGRNVPAAELSAMKPTISIYEDCNVDLERGEIACVTEVLRTLGVRENTYAILAIIGTVLAGGFGSGWLVQFLAWLWRKIRPEPKGLTPEQGDSAIENKQ